MVGGGGSGLIGTLIEFDWRQPFGATTLSTSWTLPDAPALRAILEKVLHPILFVGPERAGERIVVEPSDVRKAVALQ